MQTLNALRDALPTALRQAQAQHRPSRLTLSDPVITPFNHAMKTLGFRAASNSQGNLLLSRCAVPTCRERYQGRYLHDALVVDACPHCQTLTVVASCSTAAA